MCSSVVCSGGSSSNGVFGPNHRAVRFVAWQNASKNRQRIELVSPEAHLGFFLHPNLSYLLTPTQNFCTWNSLLTPHPYFLSPCRLVNSPSCPTPEFLSLCRLVNCLSCPLSIIFVALSLGELSFLPHPRIFVALSLGELSLLPPLPNFCRLVAW